MNAIKLILEDPDRILESGIPVSDVTSDRYALRGFN